MYTKALVKYHGILCSVYYMTFGLKDYWNYAQPITGQVTEVTCPVIGCAQPELTPNKRQKMGPGGRLNKKDGLTRYGDSHVKDKTS